MFMQLEQPALSVQAAVSKADKAVSRVPLNADRVLLMVLVLVIIPTISGVALIA